MGGLIALGLVTCALPAHSSASEKGATACDSESDHDHARRLHREGAIVSLESIVNTARLVHPGELLEVELECKRGRYVYEVEVLAEDGQVWELYFDARNGELLKQKADH